MDAPELGDDMHRRATRERRIGAGLIAIGVAGIPFFGFLAVLAANPCGAFGDACEDVGGTGDGFEWFLGLVLVCLVITVVGVAIIESSRSDS